MPPQPVGAVREPPNDEPPDHRAPHPNTLSGQTAAWRVNLALGPRGAKPAFATTVGCRFQELHLGEERRGCPHEDELGDPGSLLYQEGLLAVVVDEGNEYLAPVAGVDEPRRVDEGDAMLYR